MVLMMWPAVIVMALALQTTLFSLVGFYGVHPDIPLLITVSVGLLVGKTKGMGIGFFSGLLQDLLSGNLLGINLLGKMLIGYSCGLAEQKVYKEHLLLPVIAAMGATVIHSLMALVLLWMVGFAVNPVAAVMNQVLPLLVYNGVLAIPVHWCISAVVAFLEKHG